jgi:hypothetical protein
VRHDSALRVPLFDVERTPSSFLSPSSFPLRPPPPALGYPPLRATDRLWSVYPWHSRRVALDFPPTLGVPLSHHVCGIPGEPNEVRQVHDRPPTRNTTVGGNAGNRGFIPRVAGCPNESCAEPSPHAPADHPSDPERRRPVTAGMGRSSTHQAPPCRKAGCPGRPRRRVVVVRRGNRPRRGGSECPRAWGRAEAQRHRPAGAQPRNRPREPIPHSSRNAWAMGNRAARIAGNNPPIRPIKVA